MTSAEWAAWVQAIGSVFAIAATGFGVWYQGNKQHESALLMYQLEKRNARIELANTLYQLALNCSKAVQFISSELNDKDAVNSFVQGGKHVDWAMLRQLESALAGIPLIGLPSDLVSQPMILHSTIRQFRENVEFALECQGKIHSAEYLQFFQTMKEIQKSLAMTCSDIKTQIEHVSKEPG
jgi:hypothetical protein